MIAINFEDIFPILTKNYNKASGKSVSWMQMIDGNGDDDQQSLINELANASINHPSPPPSPLPCTQLGRY